jgi:hypothetical protein
MTATQLRYRRYLEQKLSTFAIAEFFGNTLSSQIANSPSPAARPRSSQRSPTPISRTFAKSAGFDLVVDGPDPARRNLNLH